MVEGLHRPRHEVLFSCRVKQFPAGMVEVMAADRLCFRDGDFEASGEKQKRKRRDVDREGGAVDALRAVRRARARVREIALANGFDLLATLTTDREKVDRYDDKEVLRRFAKWAENQVQRYGMKYVIVPERHKDGAIHFHGLLRYSDEKGLSESGTYLVDGCDKPRRPSSPSDAAEWEKNGARIVYNLSRWRLGFSTAIYLDSNYQRTINYVLKYIGKELEEGKIGGRYYYSGGKLEGPKVLYCSLSCEDVQTLPGAYDFVIEGVGKYVLWRGTEDVFSRVMGPHLEDGCILDFEGE